MYISCPSCSKQVLVQGILGERCYWCEKPITKKDNLMKTQKLEKDMTLDLTREEKIAIGKEAKERGIKTIAAERGLDWKAVRAWAMTYIKQTQKGATKYNRLLVKYTELKNQFEGYQQAVKDMSSKSQWHSLDG